jgi:hypothetical protein
VQSQTTEEFRRLLSSAPAAIRQKAQSAYRLWSENPDHPSLRFKKIHDARPIYSVRIDLNWRAIGVMTGGVVVWFWLGTHSDYERLLTKL